MKKIKFVVIGFGGMGSYHARDLIGKNEFVETYGVYDIDGAKNQQATEEGFNVFESYEAVLADEQVDAILVATPNDVHKDLVIQALHAGKHVVCEKPVTMSVADFDEMVEVADETGQTLMVHQNRRWDRDFLMIRELYQNQMIGELFQLESRVHGANGIPGDWRHLPEYGGGMVLDWGVHLLDQLLFLVDSPVKSVYADLSYVLGDPVDDGFVSFITFENGLRAQIEVGASNFMKLPRWYVKGTQGTALIQDWDLSGQVIKQVVTDEKVEPTPIQAGQGLTKTMAPPSEEMIEPLALPEGIAEFPEFYENVYQVINGLNEPVVKNQEVRNVLQLIEEIFESAEGNRVVN
ncbi:Gfo/Idh/MocA family protein [Vagococcus zengguangii]|uniref:Gfo/Idh/MocA family protein n=1 Tax=Vagococcus zengguangii TaxID=2571750 RepID=UPI00110820EB|nr:Gfo/Idh/MocA family oxidoreductase [Vagococcus zengguangii]TLG79427.1 Gfo/Idh/MocA family oxidoreductase [Vagococcus zengguangii]